MTRIAPVNLMYTPKTLWFDARDLEVAPGDKVVVTTARGLEFGELAEPVFEMTEKEAKGLRNPLKPVVRLANEKDCAQADKMYQLSLDAMPVFREMAAEMSAEMHPVSVQYLFDGDKAIFYFEAEDRIDFRDLVRKLANHFHVRVEMRQIGVRDEARLIGGLGHCGQELCCKRLGGEFNPVSIRMAKEQDLSLNPQKISGICGRLMCCLRYEYDAYKDFKARAPKVGASIATPAGTAKVTSLNVPREVITLKTEDDKTVKIPLEDMEPAKEGERPKEVGQEAWDLATNAFSAGAGANGSFLTSQFTGKDKLGEAKAVHRQGAGKKKGKQAAVRGGAVQAEQAKEGGAKRTRRRRRGGGGSGESAQPQQLGGQQPKQDSAAPASTRHRSKRKSVEVKAAQGQAPSASSAAPKQAEKPATRPGQKASGLRRSQGERPSNAEKPQAASAGQAAKAGQEGGASKRQPRKRASGANAKANVNAGASAAGSQPKQPASAASRQGQGQQSQGQQSQGQQSQGGQGGGQRRNRRRSHKVQGQGGEQS